MSKYKIIAFLFAVVGLVLVLIGVNKNGKGYGNVNNGGNQTNPPVENQIPEEPEPNQLSEEQKTGYWYLNEDPSDNDYYIHVISTTGDVLIFDWVFSTTDNVADKSERRDLSTTRREGDFYYFTYEGEEYTMHYNMESDYIQITLGDTNYIYSYYSAEERI